MLAVEQINRRRQVLQKESSRNICLEKEEKLRNIVRNSWGHLLTGKTCVFDYGNSGRIRG